MAGRPKEEEEKGEEIKATPVQKYKVYQQKSETLDRNRKHAHLKICSSMEEESIGLHRLFD